MKLGKKKSLTKENWNAAMRDIEQIVPTADLENRIDTTVSQIQNLAKTKKLGLAWSGGKDSIALGWLMEQAGNFPSVLGINHMEFPCFTQWVDKNQPDDLTVINSGHDISFLKEHPHLIFPSSKYGAFWATRTYHTAQSRFFKDKKLDVIALGRRTQDGNYVGGKGSNIYTTKQGITRWSPISDWSHEEIIALLKYAGLTLPHVYDHVRGFQVATGGWHQRKGTSPDPTSPRYGWAETYRSHPEIVEEAAAHNLPGAADYLKGI